MKAEAKPPKEFEALDLIALAINEVDKRGTAEHAEALELLEHGRALWKEKLWQRLSRTCPHCGKPTR